MADVPPDDEQTQGASGDTPLTGWARGVPAGPGEGSETPATGWVARAPDPEADRERTRGGQDETPLTGWAGDSSASPDEGSQTPATGWTWARPAPGSAEEEGGGSGVTSRGGAVQPDSEATAATGWVIAGTVPAPADPAGGDTPPGWPQAPAISWARAPMASGVQGPAGWATPLRRRRRSWWAGSLAVAVLALLLVAGGGIGYLAGARTAPTSAPRAQPPLRPTLGPIGTVDSPLITFRLPSGWLEQQQSGSDVKLVHFPNGSMDINVQSTSAVGASTPQAVLQKVEQHLSSSRVTVGLVSICVQPAAHTIGGRPGVEQGFQFEERGADGKTLFTNCDVAWASVRNGEVYFWEVFNTLDQLQASTVAATRMQRSAHWQE